MRSGADCDREQAVEEADLGGRDAEHGVTQKLESFVRLVAGVFSAPRPVGERVYQETRLDEVVAESLLERGGRRRGRQESAQLGDHVVDRIANGAEVLEVFVFDPEARGALGELLFDRFDQLDQGERVSIEILCEGIAFVDLGRLDLQDLRQAVLDECHDIVAFHRLPLDVGFGGHGVLPRRIGFTVPVSHHMRSEAGAPYRFRALRACERAQESRVCEAVDRDQSATEAAAVVR